MLYEMSYFLDSTGIGNGHCGSLGHVIALVDDATALRNKDYGYALCVFTTPKCTSAGLVGIDTDTYFDLLGTYAPMKFHLLRGKSALPCSRDNSLLHQSMNTVS
jgi:hypothetical protein